MKKISLYKKQKVCYISKTEISTDDDNRKYHKVRDHCHYTGKFREAPHNICNLRQNIKRNSSSISVMVLQIR